MKHTHNYTEGMMGMKPVIVALLLFAGAFTARAQTGAPDELGVAFFFEYNMHTADFRALPNVPNCCPQFTSADDVGYAVGVFYEHPINDKFSLAARLLLADRSARFAEEESTLMSIDGTSYDGIIEYSINTQLMTIGLEPVVHYRLFKNLTVGVGANIGFLVVQDYDQKEQILYPSHAVFTETLTDVRNEYSGELDNARGLMYGAVAVVRMQFPIGNGGFSLYPELTYNYTFSNIVEGLNWKPHALRAGVAVQTTF